MSRSRPYGQASFKGLCELLGDPDEIIRASVCHELGMRGRESSRAIEKLARAAAYDDEGIVRGSAATALGSIALAGDGLDEQVLEVLADVRKGTSYPITAFLAHASEIVEMMIDSRSRA